MDVVFWVAFIGLWSGLLIRIFLPYLRKLYQGKVNGWDHRYTISGIVAIFAAFIAATLAIDQVALPEVPQGGVTGAFLFKVWAANFVIGFGLTALINEILALGKK